RLSCRVVLLRRLTPSFISSFFTERLIAELACPSCSAARLKLPLSTTATKIVSSSDFALIVAPSAKFYKDSGLFCYLNTGINVCHLNPQGAAFCAPLALLALTNDVLQWVWQKRLSQGAFLHLRSKLESGFSEIALKV